MWLGEQPLNLTGEMKWCQQVPYSVYALISAGRNHFLQVRIGTDSEQILAWWDVVLSPA